MPIRRSLAISVLLAAPLFAQQPEQKTLERYRQVLVANPIEGIALDRLWKFYADKGQTNQLIAEYQRGGSFANEMILGHLLRRTGRADDARAAFERAGKLDAASPLPALALGALDAADG
jgi:tetratricopeptide (TPR) repeat protein